MSEERKAKMSLNKSGGTAGKGGITYRVTIPSTWAKAIGITEDSRDLSIKYDEKKQEIVIKKLLK